MVRVSFSGQQINEAVGFDLDPADEALFLEFAAKLLSRLEAELARDRPAHKGMSWPEPQKGVLRKRAQ